jgi:hypothetical protein
VKGRILAATAVGIGIVLVIPWSRPAAPPRGTGVPAPGPPPGTAPAAKPAPAMPTFPAPAAARSLAGTVADEASGEPLPDIPVRVWLLAGGGEEKGPREVRTGRDGAFRVDRLPPGSFRVRAGWESAEERGAHDAAEVVPVAAGTSDLRILLRKGRPLAGRVLAGDGVPFRDPFRAGSGIPGAGDPRARRGRDVSFGNAGGEGNFRIPDVRAGDHDLEILPGAADGRPPEHAALLLRGVPAGTEGIEARLVRGRSIEGFVEDEGGFPVPDGEIRAFPGGERRASVRIGGGVTRDGAFTTGLLDPRFDYDLVFTRFDPSRGVRQWGLARRVAPGTKGHRVVLGDSSPLRGRVEDGSGWPVGRGVPVRAVFADYDIDHAENAGTAADGTFALHGLGTPGAFRYRVRAGGGGGFAPSSASEPVAPGDPPAVVRVARGVSISGTLRWRSGQPLRGAMLRVGPDSGEWPLPWIATGSCDHEGRFRIGDLPPGPIRIHAGIGTLSFPCGVATAPGDGYEFLHSGW